MTNAPIFNKVREFLIVISCILNFAVYSQNAETIYKKTVNSTVTIETEEGFGSGFFISTNLIVTNYHVIKGSVEAYCYSSNSPIKYKVQGYVAVDKSNDLVLLKIIGLNRPALMFAAGLPHPGQNIYVIGTPIGLSATISSGIISGLRNFNSRELIQITAPISPGSSGGPVLNSQGLLVGVSVSQLAEGQNLNFAIPAKHLRGLLGRTSVVKELMYLDEGLASVTEMSFKSVKIGSKTWMSSNLNINRFRNGHIIAEARSEEEWKRAGIEGRPVWCYYDNDPTTGEKNGMLYNWYAVNDPRGLAPRGWHVATNRDWAMLIIELGGEFAGSRIKTSTEWQKGEGNNSTGFTAFPSGARWPDPKFRNYGTSTFWWTPEELDETSASFILLTMNSHEIYGKKGTKSWGMSVRCVKD